ncbi:hypothetical protein JHK82_022573 [Glycine max]|nr:hypothetical protein JHK86_022590 [Glycine max]KAG5137842.1 hypothetical protein JHK82_022573 [Glycine max]
MLGILLHLVFKKKGKIKWLSCYGAYGGGGMTRYGKTRMSQVTKSHTGQNIAPPNNVGSRSWLNLEIILGTPSPDIRTSKLIDLKADREGNIFCALVYPVVVLAFRDIDPQAPTHILIIPKVRDAWLTGLSKVPSVILIIGVLRPGYINKPK